MKLDKLKFAKLVQFISMSLNCDLSHQTIQELDDIIDMPIPDPVQGKVDAPAVDELLRCMATATGAGFIPAIKAYRVLTNAGLKEAKEAVEKYRQPLKKMYDPSDLSKALKDAHYDNDANYHAVERFLNNL